MLQSHDHTDAVLPAGVNLLDEVCGVDPDRSTRKSCQQWDTGVFRMSGEEPMREP